MIKVLLITLCLPAMILSWWDVGHMLTAAIAEIRLNQLDPKASVQFKELTLSINNLCDNRTRTFIESAVWPDDLKATKYNMGIWNEWHFIDSPFITDALIPTVNYTQAAMSSVVVVNQAKSALKTNVNKLTAERALFARYLIHMVGDIHQPLHSVALYNKTFPKGDLGGNSLKITILNKTVQNFHSFWDSGAFVLQNDSYTFDRPMNLAKTTQLKRIASSLIDEYGSSVEELAKNIDPAEWAKESFLVAQNTTYPFVMQHNVATQDYINLAYETSKKRITLAGYRLANFVIDVYNNSTLVNDAESNLEEIEKMFMEHAKENQGTFQKILGLGKIFNLQFQ